MCTPRTQRTTHSSAHAPPAHTRTTAHTHHAHTHMALHAQRAHAPRTTPCTRTHAPRTHTHRAHTHHTHRAHRTAHRTTAPRTAHTHPRTHTHRLFRHSSLYAQRAYAHSTPRTTHTLPLPFLRSISYQRQHMHHNLQHRCSTAFTAFHALQHHGAHMRTIPCAPAFTCGTHTPCRTVPATSTAPALCDAPRLPALRLPAPLPIALRFVALHTAHCASSSARFTPALCAPCTHTAAHRSTGASAAPARLRAHTTLALHTAFVFTTFAALCYAQRPPFPAFCLRLPAIPMPHCAARVTHHASTCLAVHTCAVLRFTVHTHTPHTPLCALCTHTVHLRCQHTPLHRAT